MKKNPFSLYDFLGYVFPGLLTIYVVAFFAGNHGEISSIGDLYNDLKVSSNLISADNGFKLLEDTIVLAVVAYVVGHFIAYLSSITVEKFTILAFGYPSDFLVKDLDPWRYFKYNSETSNSNGVQHYFSLTVLSLFLLPISLSVLVLSLLFGMRKFIIRKLDTPLIDAITKNQNRLAQALDVEHEPGSDFNRIVYHYEYARQDRHAIKMDNYVALYGFLRSMALIFNCITIGIMFIYILPTLNLHTGIDWQLVLLTVLLMGITLIFYLAFVKFYRRFTLEVMMCLVIDTSYKTMTPVKTYSISQTVLPPEEAVYNSHNGLNNVSTTTTTDNTNVDSTDVDSTDDSTDDFTDTTSSDSNEE